MGRLGLRIHAHHDAALAEDTVELNRGVSRSVLKLRICTSKRASQCTITNKGIGSGWAATLVIEKVGNQVANTGNCMEHT